MQVLVQHAILGHQQARSRAGDRLDDRLLGGGIPMCSHLAAQEAFGSTTVMMPWKLMVVQSSHLFLFSVMSRK